MRAPRALSILLIAGGLLGLVAAFALTLDEFTVLAHPAATLSCNANATLQFGKNLESWQGSVFGFPNPLIGLVMFPAPIFVGVASLAGTKLPRWFWAVFNLGMLFAIGFVAWLVTESLWVLGTLCPWCSLVYFVVIPMSLAVTLYNLKVGHLPFGKPLARLGSVASGWVPLLSLVAYVTILLVAEWRINLFAHLCACT